MASASVWLSDEQRVLVETAALSPDRVVCVVGAAGAGKTTALQVLGVAMTRSGAPVLGAAPSGRAADELGRATGMESATLHALLAEARLSGGLPWGCVVVIDEAGMAETRVLAPVLRLVEEAGGKAILVGDPAQLPAVGAGGLYAALCDRLGAVRLAENRRQRDLSSAGRLREGDPEAYLGHAAERGRLHLADDAHQAKEQLLSDWWKAAAVDMPGSVMLAHRREDVCDLNAAARALLHDAGRLCHEVLVAGGRDFRVGDRVVCRRNDPALGVRNGTCATVAGLNAVKGLLTLQTDAGQPRELSVRYAADHLDHGFALTGHAAQGATVTRAFVLIRGEGALAEWAYVACSRAREETRLYGVAPELDLDAHGLTPARMPAARSLVTALGRSSAEPLGLDHLVASHEVHAPAQAPGERPEREVDACEGRLSATHARLVEGLGFLGRVRHGRALREAMGAQPRVIAELPGELAALRTADAPPQPGLPTCSAALRPPPGDAPVTGLPDWSRVVSSPFLRWIRLGASAGGSPLRSPRCPRSP
jgi:hypothetical protein